MIIRKDRLYTYDGSKGTMYMLLGYEQFPESLNFTNRDVVYDLAVSYVDLNCDFIQTNTFNANGYALKKYGLYDRQKELIATAVDIANEAAKKNDNCNVVFTVGPIGRLMAPSGDMTYDVAYQLFYEMEEYAIDCGARMFQFETFSDILEIKIAVLALKDLCEKKNIKVDIMCSMTFEKNENTLMGNTPEQCAYILTQLGCDIIGSNCGFGGDKMVSVIRRMATCSNLPIMAKPNAGLPQMIDGKTVYTQGSSDFADDCVKLLRAGANVIGGCCGTTPIHIIEMQRAIENEELKDFSGENIRQNKVYDNPIFVYPKEWDDDSIYDIAYDCQDEENDLICIYGESAIDIANAVRVIYSVTKNDIAVSANNSLVLEEAIRRSVILPDVWLKSSRDEISFYTIAKKYSLRVLKEENVNG